MVQWKNGRVFLFFVLLFGVSSCVILPPKLGFDATPCQKDSDCRGGYSCQAGSCILSDGGFPDCVLGDKRACNSATCFDGTQVCESQGIWGKCNFITSVEICNGKDDDCDGLIDETFPEKNQFCTLQNLKGPCARGTYSSCQNGVLLCLSTSSSRPEGPEYNNCNDGIDNDCDGYVDDTVQDGCQGCKDGETRSCFPWGQGSKDPAAKNKPCQLGVETCSGGRWTYCKGAVVPVFDVCGNNIDDDCDGIVDGGNCPNPNNCKPLGGRETCYTGDPSTKGRGLCQEGYRTCQNDGKWSACVGEVLPQKEDCNNGKDDDCNGKIDDCPQECTAGKSRDCFTADSKYQGVGSCKKGQESCGFDGIWSGICVGEVTPQTEICTGTQDRNCDGISANCSHSQIVFSSWDSSASIESYSMKTSQKSHTFTGVHSSAVYAGAMHPNQNEFVTGGVFGKVGCWSISQKKLLWTQGIFKKAVNALTIHSSSTSSFVVAAGDDTQVVFWEFLSGKDLKGSFHPHTQSVWAVAVDPTGKYLATGSADQSVKVWSLQSGQVPKNLFTLKGHQSDVNAVAFDPKGTHLVSIGRDGKVLLWDITTGKQVDVLSYNIDLNVLAFSASGKWFAVGGSDGKIRLFSIQNQKMKLEQTMATLSKQSITAIAFHPEEKSILVGDLGGDLSWIEPNTSSPVVLFSHQHVKTLVSFVGFAK